jgi:hypothetical protein
MWNWLSTSSTMCHTVAVRELWGSGYRNCGNNDILISINESFLTALFANVTHPGSRQYVQTMPRYPRHMQSVSSKAAYHTHLAYHLMPRFLACLKLLVSDSRLSDMWRSNSTVSQQALILHHDLTDHLSSSLLGFLLCFIYEVAMASPVSASGAAFGVATASP